MGKWASTTVWPLTWVIFLFVASLSWADPLPPCEANGVPIAPNNNQQVVNWKFNTPNLFQARARVQGIVTRVFPDRNDHDHFEIQIGPELPAHTIEIVFSKSFGQLPNVQPGMKVEACGDYITSNAPSRYPASPSGAIVHWVHFNPGSRDQGRHEHGYVAVEGKLFGYYPMGQPDPRGHYASRGPGRNPGGPIPVEPPNRRRNPGRRNGSRFFVEPLYGDRILSSEILGWAN